MLLQCNNKGCFSLTDVKLDADTDEVICMECGKPIKNTTKFIKTQLRHDKQFLKKSAKLASFAVICAKCGKKTSPLKKDDKYYCSFCNEELKISKFFENMLKTLK